MSCKIPLLLTLAFVAACGPLPQVTARSSVALSSGQKSMIEQTIRHDLVDPSSAQFGSMGAAKVSKDDGSTNIYVCGEMNSKNRMGGYVGFSAYAGILSANHDSFTLLGMDGVDESYYYEYCKNTVGLAVSH